MPSFKPNTIYCGDNLEILQSYPDGIIDLCYIDPPFFSRRNHQDLAKGTAEVRGFHDTWSGNIENYIDFMQPRVQEIYRVLKPDGSFYLHCDVSAVFHLKVMCDEIFGSDDFLNDIVWKRHSPSKNTDRNYGSIVDHVLYYAKGTGYTFNVQYITMDDSVFNIVEPETGRLFRSQPLVVRGNQEGKLFDFGGRKYTIKKNKALKWTQETIDARLKKNPLLIYWTGSGEPRYKTYLDESKGIKLTSLWSDIKLVTSTSSERLAYPTQKPQKFMERIISVSSNPGDIVLDAFCGSGTTIVAASALGRQFAGIDASPTACRLTASRIGYPVEKIIDHPKTGEDLQHVPEFEFINWVAWKMNANVKADFPGINAVCRHTKIPVFAKQDTSLVPEDLDGMVSFIEDVQERAQRKGACVALAFDENIDAFLGNLRDEKSIHIYRFTIDDLNRNKHLDDGITISTKLF
ncbi:MAG TPA: site-specific DNA-methyltransferase [Candidatus Lokiarchaeia archaeon]|nr:site-specific DNA-methyltransferase [Candidatus Lokiarchaeia archaeon]